MSLILSCPSELSSFSVAFKSFGFGISDSLVSANPECFRFVC